MPDLAVDARQPDLDVAELEVELGDVLGRFDQPHDLLHVFLRKPGVAHPPSPVFVAARVVMLISTPPFLTYTRPGLRRAMSFFTRSTTGAAAL